MAQGAALGQPAGPFARNLPPFRPLRLDVRPGRRGRRKLCRSGSDSPPMRSMNRPKFSSRTRPSAPMTNPLNQLAQAGQAVWLDFIERKILENGEFKRLIDDDDLRGVTSNPSIFEKAIGEGDEYDDAVKAALESGGDADPATLFDVLAIADIRAACDQLRPVYDRLGGQDGYASLEVSPYLAMDTRGHHRRGQASLACGRPAEPDDQGSRHQGRNAGHPPTDRRRDQRQRHAAVRPGWPLSGRGRGAPGWPGSAA